MVQIKPAHSGQHPRSSTTTIIGSERSVIIDPVRYTVHQVSLLPRNGKTFAFEEILIKTTRQCHNGKDELMNNVLSSVVPLSAERIERQRSGEEYKFSAHLGKSPIFIFTSYLCLVDIRILRSESKSAFDSFQHYRRVNTDRLALCPSFRCSDDNLISRLVIHEGLLPLL